MKNCNLVMDGTQLRLETDLADLLVLPLLQQVIPVGMIKVEIDRCDTSGEVPGEEVAEIRIVVYRGEDERE